MATTTSGVVSQTILDTVLADVNAVVPNFSTMVSSYRLLVGAAEEIHRLPGVSPDVLARAIERFDRTGVIIDILVDLLCCKISFSSDFLAVTCAPVDLFRLLANPRDVADSPHQVAEEILLLEVLRKAEQILKGRDGSSEPPCTPPGPPSYTFATSFYQPPPAQSPSFPLHVPPETCLTRTETAAGQAVPSAAVQTEAVQPQAAPPAAAQTEEVQPQTQASAPKKEPSEPATAPGRDFYRQPDGRPRRLKK